MSYEFSERENKTIARCAKWVIGLGVITIAYSALKASVTIQYLIAHNTSGSWVECVKLLYHLTVGLAFFYGGRALKQVVDTKGNDVPHMMGALNSLSRAFTIRIAAVVVMVGLLLLGLGLLSAMTP